MLLLIKYLDILLISIGSGVSEVGLGAELFEVQWSSCATVRSSA